MSPSHFWSVTCAGTARTVATLDDMLRLVWRIGGEHGHGPAMRDLSQMADIINAGKGRVGPLRDGAWIEVARG